MENNTLSKEQLVFIVGRLLERANDSVEEKRKNAKNQYCLGHTDACYQILSILKSELTFADQDLSEFGLDIDLEKIFL